MSQMPMQSQEPAARPMSSAFRGVPSNPYQERAMQTRQQVADIEAANAQQLQSPVPTPQVGGTAVPNQQGQMQGVTPPNVPVQRQVQPINTPSTQTPPPAPAPQTAPQPAPQQYPDPALAAQLQQLQQERMYLMEQNARQMEAIQHLQAANQEYNALKQRAELQASLSEDAFGELSTVDAEDAKAISRATLNAVQKAMAPVYERLQQQQQQMYDQNAMQQTRLEQQRLFSLRDRILAAHPDLEAIQSSPEYKQYMSQRDGLSSQTRDERAAQEFRAGNTDYVIDMLNQFKGQTPSVQSIQTVAPVQSAAGSPVATSQQPVYTMRELNNLYHTGQITPEQYRELKPLAMQAWRDAG